MRKRERDKNSNEIKSLTSKKQHKFSSFKFTSEPTSLATVNAHPPIWTPPSVALSSRDKASQLKLSDDQLTVFGFDGGYRMARTTHGVHSGAYYWEAIVQESEDPQAHVRIGWSSRQGELQAPVGYDQYSFGYTDKTGICEVD